MINTPKSIEAVVKAQLCTGCGACAYAVPEKIALRLATDGYLRPDIQGTLLAEEQHRALDVCPGIDIHTGSPDAPVHPLWGPLREVSTAWSTDEGLRHQASSGGAISAIAQHLLQTGQVQAVLHIGVAADDPLRNEFKISTLPEQIARNAGSRYAPAAPLTGLQAAVREYTSVAVIGKPCDIVAARKIAARDPKVADVLKVYMSFMCAGVPSTIGTDRVLEQLEVSKQDVVEFRYRGNGWPGFASATTRTGEVRRMTYHESWGGILNRTLQFRCKICADGTGEASDLTCADAWYGDEKGYPSFEEQQGRSLLLTRTSAGEAVVRAAVRDRAIEKEPLATEDIAVMQPHQANRKRQVLSRILALLIVGRPVPGYAARGLVKASVQAGVLGNARSFLGMIKRSLK